MERIENPTRGTVQEVHQPTSWWKTLKKITLRVFLALGGIAVGITALLMWFIGDNITEATTAILERVSPAMPSDKIGTASFLMVLAFMWPIMVMFFKFWKHKLALAILAVVSVAGMVAFYHFTEDEMFGEGKEARFICDPPLPTDLPTISRTIKNPKAKGKCDEIKDPEQVAVATLIYRAQKSGGKLQAEPRIIPIEEIANDSFALFRNKVPLVYMSKMKNKDGLREMRAGPWFDNFSPGTMVPATWVAVEDIRKFYVKQKTEKEATKKAAEEKVAADLKREAEEKAAAEKAAKLKAEKEELEYKKGVYKNTLEILSDLQNEKNRLENEDRSAMRIPQTTLKVGAKEQIIIPKGIYVINKEPKVDIYVDGKKEAIMGSENAFLDLHRRGVKIHVESSTCWICYSDWAVTAPIPNANRKRLQEIEEAQSSAKRELATLREQLGTNLPKETKPLEIAIKPKPATVPPPSTSTSNVVDGEVVLVMRFIDRDPPQQSFKYKPGNENGNRVKESSKGVYITGTGKLCDTVTITIDSGPPMNLCENQNSRLKVEPGSVYNILNWSGSNVFSRNVRF